MSLGLHLACKRFPGPASHPNLGTPSSSRNDEPVVPSSPSPSLGLWKPLRGGSTQAFSSYGKVTRPALQPLFLHPAAHFQILRPLPLPLEARTLQVLHAILPRSSALSKAPFWFFDSIATNPGALPLLGSGTSCQVPPSSEPPVLLLLRHPLPSFWIGLWYIPFWTPSKPHARWPRQPGSHLHLSSSSKTGASKCMGGTSSDPPATVLMWCHHTALCLLDQVEVVDVG